jgi:14-3-3 protein epsilon
LSIEGRGNEEHVTLVKEYRGKIKAELSKICDGILKLLDSHLVPMSTAAESKVFYLKMRGDYHRLEECLPLYLVVLLDHQFV